MSPHHHIRYVLFIIRDIVYIYSFPIIHIMKIKLLFVIILFLISIPGAFAYLEISETQMIIGNGTFEKDFGVQSSPYFSGQKLAEAIVPTYPFHVNATSYYHSDFELIHSNNSSIFYESVSILPGVKHYLSNDNYELGVCTGFYFIGTQNKTFAFESSPFLSEAIVKAEAEGRSVIRVRVVNESYPHKRTADSLTWLEGDYSLDWVFLAIDVDYPEAGDDDYLPCPGGSTFP